MTLVKISPFPGFLGMQASPLGCCIPGDPESSRLGNLGVLTTDMKMPHAIQSITRKMLAPDWTVSDQ
jgi:hypothetical protein